MEEDDGEEVGVCVEGEYLWEIGRLGSGGRDNIYPLSTKGVI